MEPVEALRQLLSSEAAALQAGDLAALQALAGQKADLLASLAASPPPPAASLERLRAEAGRNAGLLAAAQRGLAAARQRLAELQRAAAPQTYDALGRRRRLGPVAAAVERRA